MTPLAGPVGAGFVVGANFTQNPQLVGQWLTCAAADLALAAGSPLINAGSTDPALNDANGSRNDIGAFGGPEGDLSAFLDRDGDGFPNMVDCNDSDAAVHLAIPETCNGRDDDCDGLQDANDQAVDAAWMHRDDDRDGFGEPTTGQFRCAADGWVENALDCNDANADVGVGIDAYLDRDGDGAGDDSDPLTVCALGHGVAAVGGDCDDTDPTVQGDCGDPGLDSNGDGLTDQVERGLGTDPFNPDSDGDGLLDASKARLTTMVTVSSMRSTPTTTAMGCPPSWKAQTISTVTASRTASTSTVTATGPSTPPNTTTGRIPAALLANHRRWTAASVVTKVPPKWVRVAAPAGGSPPTRLTARPRNAMTDPEDAWPSSPS